MKLFKLLPLFVLVLLTGCPKSRIHQEKTLNLDAGDSTELQIDGPTGNQNLKVAFKSTESAINIYVLLEDQLGGKKDDLDPTKLPAGAILASEKNSKEGTISASIPAKKAYRIFVNGATKKTTVNLKLDTF